MRLKSCVVTLALSGACALLLSSNAVSQSSPGSAPVSGGASVSSELPDAPQQRVLSAGDSSASNAGDISGTVTDAYGDVIPGATIEIVEDGGPVRQTRTADDNGFFDFKSLAAGATYKLTVSAGGFEPWSSGPLTLAAGQFLDVTEIKLKLTNGVSSVTVVADPVQIATEQVHLEEQQRVLGFIPNFYVVYDSKNAAPMTAKLKFQMAYKVAVDPVSIVGAMALAGMNQAGNTPNYRQGWKGYGQRFGAAYTDGLTDIMFGGAILPAIFHQDPRYFYQGTGTVRSRLLHALSNPFICRGDDGRREINISSMGGDLISSALSNTYYPNSNRGASLVFNGFLVSTGEREVSSVVQEFVLRKLTPAMKRQSSSGTF